MKQGFVISSFWNSVSETSSRNHNSNQFLRTPFETVLEIEKVNLGEPGAYSSLVPPKAYQREGNYSKRLLRAIFRQSLW